MGQRPVTSIAHPTTIIYDSCKWEYSSTGLAGSWQSLGVARGVKFTENFDIAKIQTDNGPDVAKNVGTHSCIISANLLEFYPPAINTIRGGLSTLTVGTTARTTDTDVYTTGQWGKGDIIHLQNQGSTSVLASITKVKSISTGNACTTYTATDDYTVVTDSQSGYRRSIVLNAVGAGGDYKDTEALKIKYAYTAISNYTLKSGGLTTITPYWHRLTNQKVVSGVTKYFYIVIYSGSMNKGLDFAFKSANESDSVLEMPFEIQAELDTTRSVGDQLFYIESEYV